MINIDISILMINIDISILPSLRNELVWPLSIKDWVSSMLFDNSSVIFSNTPTVLVNNVNDEPFWEVGLPYANK
jgi:hypothetical protein